MLGGGGGGGGGRLNNPGNTSDVARGGMGFIFEVLIYLVVLLF